MPSRHPATAPRAAPGTVHARLLLAIVRRNWDEAASVAEVETIDPLAFVEQARECDVPGSVHALLEREGRWDLVGDEARAALGKVRHKIRHDNLLLLARTEQALDLLLEAGVTPVGLKGLDTLHRFHGRFDERTLDDVDLLIPRAQLQRTLEVLEGAGWTTPPEPDRTRFIRSSHHLPIRSPGPITVDFEIHWNLAQEMRYSIDDADLIERAVPLTVAGREILRLEDHDFVAHLLVHHLSHYFDRRLKWLLDLSHVVRLPGFEWPTVIERVRQWQAGAACGISLVHLQKLWPELIGGEVTALLPVAAWRRLLTLPLRSSHPLELFRNTRNRRVQLYLAAMMLERPSSLPRWLRHRAVRDASPNRNPLDRH